jgi:hypothetical protein
MSTMTRIACVAIIATSLGCGSHPPPPPGKTVQTMDAAVDAPPLDQDLPRLAARGVKLYEEVARAFEAAGEDCVAAAAKLGALTKTYEDVVAANAKVLHEGRGMQLKLALRPYDAQFNAAAKAVMSAKTLPACSQDPTFASAYNELVGRSE